MRTFFLNLSGSCVGVQDCWVRIVAWTEKTSLQKKDEDSGNGAAGSGYYISRFKKWVNLKDNQFLVRQVVLGFLLLYQFSLLLHTLRFFVFFHKKSTNFVNLLFFPPVWLHWPAVLCLIWFPNTIFWTRKTWEWNCPNPVVVFLFCLRKAKLKSWKLF